MFHEVDNCVLDNFGVHVECGNFVGFTKAEKHGVGHIAHTALQGQERRRYCSAAKFVDEEVAHVVTYHLSGFVKR